MLGFTATIVSRQLDNKSVEIIKIGSLKIKQKA
jgi:hypothetical protein